MPKRSKRQISSKLNGKKGGFHETQQSQEDLSDETDTNDSDNDFVFGSQPRPYDNSSSSFIMTILMLQTVVDAASWCDCNMPNYKIDVASYRGFNCNLLLVCKCGNEKRLWAAPENLDEGCLLACKLSGIQLKQIENFMTFMNFGYTNQRGQSHTVNVYHDRIRNLSQALDIKLDEMKKTDEQNLFDQILASSDIKVVEISTDGMYPIRNNSGICVSSVMGTINGVKKIICK